MPRAQEARLRDAAVEYLQAVRGDGPGHRTSVMANQDAIKHAQAVVDSLGGDQGIRSGFNDLTPGQAAARSGGGGVSNDPESAARALME